jgi:hypothetical protein
MMYVSGPDGAAQWWVGCQLPDIHPVTHIQADGDELEYIRKLFPVACEGNCKRVQEWNGAAAAMLYQILWERTTGNCPCSDRRTDDAAGTR